MIDEWEVESVGDADEWEVESVSGKELNLALNAGKLAINRTADLAGSMVSGLGKVITKGSEYAADGINYLADTNIKPAPIGGFISDVVAPAISNFDAGYQEHYSMEKLVKDPNIENVMGMIAEKGVASIPDMYMAIKHLPVYIGTRTEEIANERAQQDGRDQANANDYLISFQTAVATSLMERIAPMEAMGTVSSGVIDGVKNIGKTAYKEAGTEFLQENLEYFATNAGTEKGWDGRTALMRGGEGAIVGGGVGGVTSIATQGYNKFANKEAAQTNNSPNPDQSTDTTNEVPQNEVPPTINPQEEAPQPEAPNAHTDSIDLTQSDIAADHNELDPNMLSMGQGADNQQQANSPILSDEEQYYADLDQQQAEWEASFGVDNEPPMFTDDSIEIPSEPVINPNAQPVVEEVAPNQPTFEDQEQAYNTNTTATELAYDRLERGAITPEQFSGAIDGIKASSPVDGEVDFEEQSNAAKSTLQQANTKAIKSRNSKTAIELSEKLGAKIKNRTKKVVKSIKQKEQSKQFDTRFEKRLAEQKSIVDKQEQASLRAEYDKSQLAKEFRLAEEIGIERDFSTLHKAITQSLKPTERDQINPIMKDFVEEEAQLSSIEEGANEAATSPTNERAEPSEAQKQAGNYKKGRVRHTDLDIAIENPKGSIRTGKDETGKKWESKMASHYGDITGTVGADGDAIDVFIKPETATSEKVFIVNQVDPNTKAFDEHKVMLGFDNLTKAKRGYYENYDKSWYKGHDVVEVTKDEFSDWLKNGDTTKPFVKKSKVADATPEMKEAPSEEAAQEVTPVSEPDEKPIDKVQIKPTSKPLTPTALEKQSTEIVDKLPKAKEEKQPKAKVEKIDDFGEVLQGANKHNYTFNEKLNDDVDVEAVPLSKSFPQPDYEKLSSEGADPRALAFIAQLRGEIKPKPRQAGKLQRWSAQVSEARHNAKKLLEMGEDGSDVMIDSLQKSNKGRGGYLKYLPLILDIAKEIPAKNIKALGDYKLEKQFYTLFRGEKGVNKWVVTDTKSKGGFGGMGNMKHFDTSEEAVAHIKSQVTDESIVNGKKLTKFDVWSERGKQGVFFLGKKIGTGKFIELKQFPTAREAREYSIENNEELVDLLKEKRKIKAHRRPDNNPRIGDDHRKGIDATPEMFDEAFGFRGVQFGNWVENNKRQNDLNYAYDGLMDLAGILDLPSKALSLNGDLGLAFGARGKGGENAASAHYEPGTVVINLTKKMGSGSLAHEWWHALDNYFSKMDKTKLGSVTKNFITEGGRSLGVKKDGKHQRATSEDFGVRQEVYDAFTSLTKAIKNETKLAERSAELDKLRGKDYWGTVIEMTARSFERYVIDKLAKKGFESDYLANIVKESSTEASKEISDYPYPLAVEMDVVNKAYDGIFDILQTKETDKGLALFSADTSIRVSPNKISLEQAQKVVDDFKAEYNGNIPLDFRVVEKQEELYGPANTVEKVGLIKGSYHPKSGIFGIASSNMQDRSDARETLRHEILGHFGLNTFKPKDKKAILQKIINSKNDSSLKEAWEKVDKNYPELDVMGRAEEVFASIAENPPKSKSLWNDLVILVRKALRFVGIGKGSISKSEIESYIQDISNSIKSGKATQQTFPKSDQDQFRKGSDKQFYQTKSQQNVLRSIGDWAKSSIGNANMLRKSLLFTTDNQIIDIFGKLGDGFGVSLRKYNRLRGQLEGERQRFAQEAERKVEEKWDKLKQDDSNLLGEVMHDATMSKLHPEIDFYEQPIVRDLQDKIESIENTIARTGRMSDKQEAALDSMNGQIYDLEQSYNIVSEKFQRLSPEAKELYSTVESFYKDTWNETKIAIVDRINEMQADDRTKRVVIDQISQEFEKAINDGPYFPLKRFGDHVVVLEDRTDGNKVLERHHFESKAEAKKFQKENASDDIKARYTLAKPFTETSMGDLPTFAKDMAANLKKLSDEQLFDSENVTITPEQVIDDIWQAMLRSLPQQSAAKSLIHRKRVKGASTDGRRGFADSIYHQSFRIARIKFAHKMQNELNNMEKIVYKNDVLNDDDADTASVVFNEMVKRHDMTMNPQGNPIVGTLGALGFLYYLSGSVAAGAVNMTQTWLVAYPMLGARHGFNTALTELSKASMEYFTSPKNFDMSLSGIGQSEAWISLSRNEKLSSNEQSMLKVLYDDGTIDVTQAHALSQVSDTDMKNSPVGSRLKTRGVRALGAFFHNAEVYNREVTALAAFRMYMKRNPQATVSQATSYARNSIEKTHFNYSSSNRARAMRHDSVKLITQFKQYSQNMIYTLGRGVYQSMALGATTQEEKIIARKQTAGILALHFAMGGVIGAPLIDLVFSAIDFADDDELSDAKNEFKDYMHNEYGLLGDMITRGSVNATTNVNIGSRVALNSLLFRTPDRELTAGEQIQNYAQELAGPLVALGARIPYAAKLASDGDYTKAIEKVVPKFVSDPIKAVRYSTEGVTNGSGNEIMSANDFTINQAIFQAIGFSSDTLARHYEERGAEVRMLKRISNSRSKLMKDAYKAISEGENFDDVLNDISEFNSKYPQHAITKKSLKASVAARMRNNEHTVNGVRLSPKHEYIRDKFNFID